MNPKRIALSVPTGKYIIVNHSRDLGQVLFWNNEDGWGAIETADIFTEKTSDLPTIGTPGAEWLQLEAIVHLTEDVLEAGIEIG